MRLVRSGPGAIAAAAVLAGGCGGMPSSPEDPPSSSPRSSAPPTASSAPSAAPSPTSSRVAPPPYIDRIEWVQETQGPVLQVFPTDSGRIAQGETVIDTAWQEVVALAPDAPTPGMREQFNCHWVYARVVEPDKASWNLEPWRPAVTAREMIETGCNPPAR